MQEFLNTLISKVEEKWIMPTTYILVRVAPMMVKIWKNVIITRKIKRNEVNV